MIHFEQCNPYYSCSTLILCDVPKHGKYATPEDFEKSLIFLVRYGKVPGTTTLRPDQRIDNYFGHVVFQSLENLQEYCYPVLENIGFIRTPPSKNRKNQTTTVFWSINMDDFLEGIEEISRKYSKEDILQMGAVYSGIYNRAFLNKELLDADMKDIV